MPNIIREAKQRLCAIEVETVPCAAVPYFIYKQDKFPYFTHRLGDTTYTENSEEIDINTRLIVARLVIGHFTSGYEGQKEELLDDWILQLENAFQSDDGTALISERFPTEPRWLYVTGMSLQPGTALRAFSDADPKVAQVGVEFNLSIPFFMQYDEE